MGGFRWNFPVITVDGCCQKYGDRSTSLRLFSIETNRINMRDVSRMSELKTISGSSNFW